MAEDIQKKLTEDPDWIAIKRFNNSLNKLLERYPDGCPDRVIAQALGITESEVSGMYDAIVKKLRHLIT